MAGAAAGALSAADVEERLTDLDEGEAAPGGETARATVMLDSCAAACPYASRGSDSNVKPIIIPLTVEGNAGPGGEGGTASAEARGESDARKAADQQSASGGRSTAEQGIATANDHAATTQPTPARSADGPTYQDRLSKQAALVRQHYRLSARETEVMELIARGNTVARIAEQLVVSENTIRTHSKRIYAKLDIHKKQELLDLVETFNPKDLKE